ncbi:peroxiredoxin-like family protein [Denitromonas iodatirespirans]|uniref:AhpC/TSA family protein n=1 Tax=Denitromonas iodatirespirans TaxID=2795389 RepID=A0A944DA60_DENI1|nr:peroxiredoxin-like family protein [Denitromonas iodatirespirans]MBT0961572.1 AhpC/TSA family protein [Denitromonas iodatirespirans]
MLIPRQPVPPLKVATLAGVPFDIHADNPDTFTMVAFYRGLHCPICAKYLMELERLTPEFAERGVNTIAISSDDQTRAQAMADKVNAQHLRFGYDLPLSVARQWGLYVSASRGKTSIGIEEPALFSEPGLFIVRPDGTLYYGAVQTMPFARPLFSELLGAVDFVLKNNYPARGEVVADD